MKYKNKAKDTVRVYLTDGRVLKLSNGKKQAKAWRKHE